MRKYPSILTRTQVFVLQPFSHNFYCFFRKQKAAGIKFLSERLNGIKTEVCFLQTSAIINII